MEDTVFPRTWSVNYSDQLTSTDYEGMDLLITSSAFIPPQEGSTKYIAYVSVGEVSQDSPDFNRFKNSSGILLENPNWDGAWVWNWADQKYKDYLYDEVLPEIAVRFDGFFFDTIDSALYFAPEEDKNQVRSALVDFVQEVRKKYPHHKIILNRGFDVLPFLRDSIDMLMIENMVGGYDFEKEKYQLQCWQDYHRLKRMVEAYDLEIPILALNYAERDDWEAKILSFLFSRRAGMIPAVAPIDLLSFDPDNSYLQELSEERLENLLSQPIHNCLVLYKSSDRPVPSEYEPVILLMEAFKGKPYSFIFHDMSKGKLPSLSLVEKCSLIVSAYESPQMAQSKKYILFLRRQHFSGGNIIILNNLGCYFEKGVEGITAEHLSLFLAPWGLEYHFDWLSEERIDQYHLPEDMSLRGMHLYTAHKGESLYYCTYGDKKIPVWHQLENGIFIQEGFFPDRNTKSWNHLQEIIRSVVTPQNKL